MLEAKVLWRVLMFQEDLMEVVILVVPALLFVEVAEALQMLEQAELL